MGEPFDDRRALAEFIAERIDRPADAVYLHLGYRCIETDGVNECIDVRDNTYYIDAERLEGVAPDGFVEKVASMITEQDDMKLEQ